MRRDDPLAIALKELRDRIMKTPEGRQRLGQAFERLSDREKNTMPLIEVYLKAVKNGAEMRTVLDATVQALCAVYGDAPDDDMKASFDNINAVVAEVERLFLLEASVVGMRSRTLSPEDLMEAAARRFADHWVPPEGPYQNDRVFYIIGKVLADQVADRTPAGENAYAGVSLARYQFEAGFTQTLRERGLDR